MGIEKDKKNENEKKIPDEDFLKFDDEIQETQDLLGLESFKKDLEKLKELDDNDNDSSSQTSDSSESSYLDNDKLEKLKDLLKLNDNYIPENIDENRHKFDPIIKKEII